MPHPEVKRTSDRNYLSLNTGRTDHRTFDRLASLAVLRCAVVPFGTRTEDVCSIVVFAKDLKDRAILAYKAVSSGKTVLNDLNKIKQCRRIATRYDKLAANCLAFIQLASIGLWLQVL